MWLFMEDLHHNCGLAAVSLFGPEKKWPKSWATHYLYGLLLQQQNRGQLSAGITTYNSERDRLIKTHKGLGLVNQVFKTHHEGKNKSIVAKMKGSKGIGHVRYATSGKNESDYAQPFERQHGRKWKWFSFGLNGNIANYSDLKTRLKKKQYHLVRQTDTELLMHYISKEFVGDKKKSLKDVFNSLSRELDGAYNINFINADGQVAISRDPIGFRPLIFGKNGHAAMAASESVALASVGVEKMKDVKPGEMILFNGSGFEKKRYAKNKKTAHCMFEWVYFANVSSKIDGEEVYKVRWNLGKNLAKRETEKVNSDEYIVVPAPDTAKPAADAFALELGLPSMEGLIRNRSVGRTFIEPSERAAKVKNKFILNKSVLKGKKVFLVDDSVVRGTTSKMLVEHIKSGGAKEVHLRVCCPPIMYPCFYGIDMSTLNELVANRYRKPDEMVKALKERNPKLIEKIRKYLKADSLIYQTVEDLVKAIGKPKKELCTACLTGEYPTPGGQKLIKLAVNNLKKGKKDRTYEC